MKVKTSDLQGVALDWAVADNERLKALAVAGADLAIDVANTGIEATKRSDELQAENEALKVYVEKMRYELAACQSVLFQLARAGEVTPAYADDAKKVLQSTPQQCLREIRAEAGRAGYFRGADDAWKYLTGTSAAEQMTGHLANQYAERVKGGGV